jgi:hypothetical protein
LSRKENKPFKKLSVLADGVAVFCVAGVPVAASFLAVKARVWAVWSAARTAFSAVSAQALFVFNTRLAILHSN